MTTDQFRARVAAYVLCGVSPARAMVMARRDGFSGTRWRPALRS
jgi:hypothetical protein